MKKIISSLLIVFCALSLFAAKLSNVKFGKNKWNQYCYIDDFGDSTDRTYVSFENANIRIIAESGDNKENKVEPAFYIALLDNKGTPLKSYNDTKLQIKDENGNLYSFSGSTEDGYVVYKNGTIVLYSLLSTNNKLKLILGSSDAISIDCNNFGSLCGNYISCLFAKYGCMDYRGDIKSFTIPEGVTELGERAFDDFRDIYSIHLPSTLKTIGESAFYGCHNIEEIDFPNSLEIIGANAFSGCKKLQSIILPDSVKEIGIGAFSSAGLEKIQLNEGLQSIGNYAFSNTKVTEITLPSTIEKIGYSIFDGVNTLSHITCMSTKKLENTQIISNNSSLTISVHEASWVGCVSNDVDSIELCEGVTTIPDNTFYRYKTKNFVLPNTLVEIGECAFEDTQIESIKIPDSVEHIGFAAFRQCRYLTEVVLPNNLKEISRETFYRCSSLSEIDIPNSVSTIGYAAFAECKSLQKVVLNEGLQTIGDFAFSNCEKIKEISIPSSVKNLGVAAFQALYSCTSYIHIPSGVTTIPDNLFTHSYKLTGIELPETITEIGEYSFAGCLGVKSIKLPKGVMRVGRYAFTDWKNNQQIICYFPATRPKQLEYSGFYGWQWNSSATISYAK